MPTQHWAQTEEVCGTGIALRPVPAHRETASRSSNRKNQFVFSSATWFFTLSRQSAIAKVSILGVCVCMLSLLVRPDLSYQIPSRPAFRVAVKIKAHDLTLETPMRDYAR